MFYLLFSPVLGIVTEEQKETRFMAHAIWKHKCDISTQLLTHVTLHNHQERLILHLHSHNDHLSFLKKRIIPVCYDRAR